MRSTCSDKRAFALLSCLIVLGGRPALAQDLTEVRPINFGTIAIISYASVGRVTIFPSGTYSYNSNVYLLTPPQIGEYQLTGAPANTAYTINVPPSVAITGPGGPFTLDNIEVRPLTLVTDAAGEDTITISGRLETLGGGVPYNDGTYSTTFTVTLNF